MERKKSKYRNPLPSSGVFAFAVLAAAHGNHRICNGELYHQDDDNSVAAVWPVHRVCDCGETTQVTRVNGIDVFYGVIPAEIISRHPTRHVETKMHGGVPRGSGQHHLIVSIFDVKTGQRIQNAR